MIDIKSIQESLIKHLEEAIVRVKELKITASFKVDQLTTSQIKNENFVREFADKLPKTGNYIYYFEADDYHKLRTNFIDRPEGIYKYARLNNVEDNKALYVGSCTSSKLGSRFKQHCGWKDPKTYSLQLSKWIGNDELTFTFAYVEIKDKLVVQLLEDHLHQEVKPLFGKPGGNNKIAAVK